MDTPVQLAVLQVFVVGLSRKDTTYVILKVMLG